MLFQRELARNIKPFIITTVICSAMVLYIISMSTSFGKDIQQILDIKLPKNMQAAFGMKGLDYSKPGSFFALSFSYIYLFISIYFSSIFAVIVSKEFSEKTAEYLFSLPEKRIKIIFTKLSVAFLYSFLSVLIIFLTAWFSMEVFTDGNYDLAPILLMSLAWLIGGITFGSISYLLSSFYTKTRTVSSISVGMVLIMYLMQVVISVNEKAEFLKYISPFDWFKGAEIDRTVELSIIYCIIAIVVTVSCIFLGSKRFNKMDVLI
jgi:ABC-2 type transport system permease protein